MSRLLINVSSSKRRKIDEDVESIAKNNASDDEVVDEDSNCKGYLKFAICMHLVAFSNNFNLDLYQGLIAQTKLNTGPLFGSWFS